MWKNLFCFKLNKTVSNNDLDRKLFDASHIVCFESVLWKICVANSRKTTTGIIKWHDKNSAIITNDPGSKPDHTYARRSDGQLHLEELSTNLGSSEKNTSLYRLYWYNVEVANLKVIVVKFRIVFVKRRDSVYTKGCDPIGAVTHSVHKLPLKLSAHTKRTAVYAWPRKWSWS